MPRRPFICSSYVIQNPQPKTQNWEPETKNNKNAAAGIFICFINEAVFCELFYLKKFIRTRVTRLAISNPTVIHFDLFNTYMFLKSKRSSSKTSNPCFGVALARFSFLSRVSKLVTEIGWA